MVVVVGATSICVVVATYIFVADIVVVKIMVFIVVIMVIVNFKLMNVVVSVVLVVACVVVAVVAGFRINCDSRPCSHVAYHYHHHYQQPSQQILVPHLGPVSFSALKLC